MLRLEFRPLYLSIVARAPSPAKTVKQASSKHAQKNTKQASKVSKSPAKKAAAHKVASAHKTVKPEEKQHTAKAKGLVKHHATAKKSKPQGKAETRTTASLK